MAATDERFSRMHRGTLTTRQRKNINIDDAMAGLVWSMRWNAKNRDVLALPPCSAASLHSKFCQSWSHVGVA